MGKKKLTDPSELKNKNPHKDSIPTLLRTNDEISNWLDVIFQMRDAGEIDMTFSSIAEELSLFIDRDVPPRQINGLFLEWQRKQRRN